MSAFGSKWTMERLGQVNAVRQVLCSAALTLLLLDSSDPFTEPY